MQNIREWALAVCMACIALGILQQFVNVKGNFSVIKLVMTLYILITAFAPLNLNQEMNINFDDYFEEQSYELTSQELVLNMAQLNLKQEILNVYTQNDVSVKDVKVYLENEDNISISSISIIAHGQTDTQKAVDLAKTALDTDVDIQIISEE